MAILIHSKSKQILLALIVLTHLPAVASAHVKWFVDENTEGTPSTAHFSFLEPEVQYWTVVILVGIIVALLLDRYLPAPPAKMLNFTETNRRQILHLFQVMVGLALLITSVQGAILAPHLEEPSILGLLMRFIQGGVGLLFIANVAVPTAALAMMALFAAHSALFGFIPSLEYFNFLGIAVFLYLRLIAEEHPASRYKPLALPLLRIHTGIALGVLAWTEKLIDPSLAMQFLEKNQINFMQSLGIDFFSDRLFVLCAGCTELLFAIIFMLGLISRLNTLVLAGFLISSNLYFFLMGKVDEGFLEITGHLPIFAIAIIFVLYGGGEKLCLTNLVFRKARPEAKELSEES